MLKEKVQVLLKSLPQRLRSRLRAAAGLRGGFRRGTADDVRRGRSARGAARRPSASSTQIAVQRTDFKLETLPAHLFMNFKVVDEHGRQLEMGRNLARAEGRARRPGAPALPGAGGGEAARAADRGRAGAGGRGAAAGASKAAVGARRAAAAPAAQAAATRYTDVDLRRAARAAGNRQGGQTLIGFPALVDKRHALRHRSVRRARRSRAQHRAGLRRLFALQLKEPIKYLEKNIPDLQKMSVQFMALGTPKSCATRSSTSRSTAPACKTRCPTTTSSSRRRLDEGRSRLT